MEFSPLTSAAHSGWYTASAVLYRKHAARGPNTPSRTWTVGIWWALFTHVVAWVCACDLLVNAKPQLLAWLANVRLWIPVLPRSTITKSNVQKLTYLPMEGSIELPE